MSHWSELKAETEVTLTLYRYGMRVGSVTTTESKADELADDMYMLNHTLGQTKYTTEKKYTPVRKPERDEFGNIYD